MQKKQTMGSQLQQLLATVSTHGNQHVCEIERDLAQTNMLLDEAVRKLGNSFLAIHQGLTSYQNLTTNIPDAGLADQLATLQTEITQHINAAVTGLQFQDMTSQLINKMTKHIAELHDVFAVMDRSDRQIPEVAEDTVIVEILNNMNTDLERQQLVFDDLSRKIVSQRHLESGDIELF